MAEQFYKYDEESLDKLMQHYRFYMGKTRENLYEDRRTENFTRMDKKFLSAVSKGKDIETLEKMLKKGANPNCRDRDPYDEVIYDEELYDELTHPTYNHRDYDDGYTQRYKRKHKGVYEDAMTKAIQNNNTNTATWLITQGYVCKPYTKNPLILAMEKGNDALVDRFLAEREKIHLVLSSNSPYTVNVDGYKNPLVAAVKLNKPEYFKKLVKAGANILELDGAVIDEVFRSGNPRMVEVLVEGLKYQGRARPLTSGAYDFDTIFSNNYERYSAVLNQTMVQGKPLTLLKGFELIKNPPVNLTNDIIDKALDSNNFDLLMKIIKRDDINLNDLDLKDVIAKAVQNENSEFLEQLLQSDYKMSPTDAVDIAKNVDGILGPDKQNGKDSVNEEIKSLFLNIVDNNYTPQDYAAMVKSLGKDKEGIIFDMLKQADQPLPPEIKEFVHHIRRHQRYEMLRDMYAYQNKFNEDGKKDLTFIDKIIEGFFGKNEVNDYRINYNDNNQMNKEDYDDIEGMEQAALLDEDAPQEVFNYLATTRRFDTVEHLSFFNSKEKPINFDTMSKVAVDFLSGNLTDKKFDENGGFAKILRDPRLNLDVDKEMPSGKLLLKLVNDGNYDFAKELIKNKAVDVNYQDEAGNCVILNAIGQRENPQAVEFCKLLMEREDFDKTLKNKDGLSVEEAVNVLNETYKNKQDEDENEFDM